MAPGFVFYPAEAGGTGHCPASGSNRVQAQPAQSEAAASCAVRYCMQCSNGCSRQRDQGSLRRLSYACVAWPPRQQVEPGTARPLTLSNAVPWVRSERDTFQSGQLLVGAWRRGASN